MSDICQTCGRSGPRDFDEIMVRRIVDHGRQPAAGREDRWEAIRVMLVDGKSYQGIAKHMRVSTHTVAQVARVHGLERPAADMWDVAARAEEMVRRYDAGQTIAQIAVAMSRAESTVRKHLERGGCTFRGPGWK